MKKILLIGILLANLFAWGQSPKKKFFLAGEIARVDTRIYKAEEVFGDIEKGMIINTFLHENNISSIRNLNHLSSSFKDLEVPFSTLDWMSYFVNSTQKYEHKNSLSEKDIFNSKGDLQSRTIYKYEGSKIIEVNTYNPDGTLNNGTSYRYNKGRLRERQSKNSTENLERVMYEYNENGRLINIKRYDRFGNFAFEEIFTYDNKGLQKEKTIYKANNKQVGLQISYKYDEFNRIIRTNYLSVEEPTKSRYYSTQPDPIKVQFRYIYGVEGFLIEEQLLVAKGEKEINIACKYDQNGNISEYSDKENTMTFKYTFDTLGNWTYLIIYLNDKPIEIVEREFTYK